MQAVAVPTRIDVDNAMQVLAGLRESTRGTAAAPLALDLSLLREFDSSALSILLQLARDRNGPGEGPGIALAAGSTGPDNPTGRTSGSALADRGATPAPAAASPLFLLDPPPKLRELAELYGVAEMLFGTAGASDQARSRDHQARG